MTARRARILMLEDDLLMGRAVQRMVSRIAEVTLAPSCAAANIALAAGRWNGFVVDVSLPDGSGLAWLAAARDAGREAPALVLTNNLDRDLVNEVFDLRAFYVCKPAPAKSFQGFVTSLLAKERARETFGLLSASAMRVFDGNDLSRVELDVIAAALSGLSSNELIESQRITINTYKTRVRGILKKTGARSIGELRDRVLREMSRAPEWTTPEG